jgi:hypothetical protein
VLDANDEYTTWFSTLQSAFNQVKTYSGETLDAYMTAIEKFAMEKYELYITSCFACKTTANYLIEQISCSGLIISNLKKAGCMTAIGAFSSGVGILYSGVICSGLSYLFDQLSGKITGTTLTELCNSTTGIAAIVNNMKSQICSLCNTYMPTFNCYPEDDSKKVCPQLACKDILHEEGCSFDPQGCVWTEGKCAKNN